MADYEVAVSLPRLSQSQAAEALLDYKPGGAAWQAHQDLFHRAGQPTACDEDCEPWPELVAHIERLASQTGDGVGASPAATAEPRTPSAQAEQDDRTPTPSPPQCCGLPLDDEGRCVHRPWHIQKNAAPSSPRTFELVRHHDVSGQTGTGVVAEGVQFTDGSAALRWRGGHPATAVWPNVEEILAVHGHSGATELVWLDEDPKT